VYSPVQLLHANKIFMQLLYANKIAYKNSFKKELSGRQHHEEMQVRGNEIL
jgi:hypothetical protein